MITGHSGTGRLLVLSRGHGNCRITNCCVPHTWRVVYYNSQDAVILNTVEVVGVPKVACAAPEDLTDARRVQALAQAFGHIGPTRLQGVPVQNPQLGVQAIGFETLPGLDPALDVLAGNLLTPWFMNLVRLPVAPYAAGQGWLARGARRVARGAVSVLNSWEPLKKASGCLRCVHCFRRCSSLTHA